MKKTILMAVAIICSLSAHAQFTVYEPLIVPSTPSTSRNIYSPFTIYEPVFPNMPRRQAPKEKVITLKGYYQKTSKWYVAPIRVVVTEDDVKLASIKVQNRWDICNAAVYEVSAFDTETIQDNFNFKAFTTIVGYIYF